MQSSLLYSAEIWGLAKHSAIEKVHTFGCKRFLGLDPRTPNHMLYGDLGRFPLYINGCIRSIKYWLKIGGMETDRLPKQAYVMLSRCPIPEGRNWAKAIELCLYRSGFGFVWLNGGVADINCFLSNLKLRLKDCYMQEWNSANNSSKRYEWYSSFKTDMCLEEYFSSIHIKKFRDALIRFRFGINDLKTNLRHQDIQNTLCLFCQQIEDERHFLITCHAYDELRRKYLACALGRRPSARLCISIMQNTDVTKIRSLAMYIYHALKLRECTLNAKC